MRCLIVDAAHTIEFPAKDRSASLRRQLRDERRQHVGAAFGYRDLASAQQLVMTVLPLAMVFFPIGAVVMGGLLRLNASASTRQRR